MPTTYGLYGNDGPAYKVGANKYSFPYPEIVKDEPEWEYIVHESILTGKRTFTQKGAHHVVEMILYLYKYGNLDDTHSAADTIQDLLWNDTDFTYYKHSNGAELKDSGGTAVNFKLVEFKPFYVETSDYKDAIYIKFISTDYVKIVPTQT